MVAHAATLLRRAAGPVPVIDPATRGLWVEVFSRADWRARWADLDTLSSDSGDVLKRTLLKMHALGNWRRLVPAPNPKVLLGLTERHPHFAELIEELADEAALARRVPRAGFHMQPRLLTGPPGCGKTSFSQALAQLLGSDYRFLSMATTSAGFALAGLALGWATAGPGEVHTFLACTPNTAANSILLLDEIDKIATDARYRPSGPLLSLLEPTTAKEFRDEAVQVPLDATHLNFVATANDLNEIEPALRSRFAVHHVRRPTPAEAVRIAHHVYVDLRLHAPWGASFEPTLPDAVAERLAVLGPREQARALRRAFAKAARDGRGTLVETDIATDAETAADSSSYGRSAMGFTAQLSARETA